MTTTIQIAEEIKQPSRENFDSSNSINKMRPLKLPIMKRNLKKICQKEEEEEAVEPQSHYSTSEECTFEQIIDATVDGYDMKMKY